MLDVYQNVALGLLTHPVPHQAISLPNPACE